MSWNTKEELARYEIRMCLWKTNWYITKKVLDKLAESGLSAKGYVVRVLAQIASYLIRQAYHLMVEEEEKMINKEGAE